jgi:flagellar hook-basal body complex protein FliE
MFPIGSVTNFQQAQMPKLDLGNLEQMGNVQDLEMRRIGGMPQVQAPSTVQSTGTASFGAILDHMVGDVNTKMEAGAAEQAKVLSGESTNLHQAMISMQEASVAFSLMVEVRNKLVESYQELMRMQV